LAYTKELIELHKGSIEVESKFGQGASFKIILPVHENYYSKSEISPDATPEKSFKPDYNQLTYLQQIISQETDNNITDEKLLSSDVNAPIMLIIEDNNDLRTFIKSIFISEYKVLEASNGMQGLKIANEVIPDNYQRYNDARMDGLELCGKLKSNIHTNHIPILLTSKTGDDYTLDGLKTGADDYQTKPFNSEILAARINSLILSRKYYGTTLLACLY
jgi:PleD family two-component response regulator